MMNVREWALPVYTILMQLAVGTLAAFWLMRGLALARYGRQESDRLLRNPMLVVFFTVLVAMIGSHFHLSKPYLSFLSVLNFGSSWLSREIVFTALFFLALGGLLWVQLRWQASERLMLLLGWLVVASGLLAVYSMAMIYLLPTQAAWNTPATIVSYFKSTLLLGAMATSSLLTLDLKFVSVLQPGPYPVRTQIIREMLRWLSLAAVAAALMTLALEAHQLQSLSTGNASAQASLSLWLGIYRPLFIIRLGLLFAGVTLLALTVEMVRRMRSSVYELVTPTYVACLMVMIAEVLGRFLFYATHVRVGI